MDLKKLLKIVVGVVVILLVFQAGIFVGHRRGGDNFPNGHGSIGRVVETATSSIVVADRDNVEKVITIVTDTAVRLGRNVATSSDIKVGDFVAVLGTPDQSGQIQAKLIRILPPPPKN